MIIKQDVRPRTETFIKIRTEFEGYHCYPAAGTIDSRIKFLEK